MLVPVIITVVGLFMVVSNARAMVEHGFVGWLGAMALVPSLALLAFGAWMVGFELGVFH